MPTFKKATIRSYDAASHEAVVQIEGSLDVWLGPIPVATDIPPLEVQAGRQCAVLFFREGDAADAVVVTVHNALPSPSGGASTFLALADTPSAYTGYADYGPRVNVGENALEWAKRGNVASLYASSYPNGVAVDPAALSGIILGVADPNVAYSGVLGLAVQIGAAVAGAGGAVRGVGGYALARPPATTAYGLEFFAGVGGGAAATSAYGTKSTIFVGGTLTTAYNLHASLFRLSGSISAYYGLYLADIGAQAQARLQIYEAGSGAAGDAHGNRLKSNTQFGSLTGSFGGGNGVIGIANAATVPAANPTGGGVLYANGGALYWRGSSGTVTMIAPA